MKDEEIEQIVLKVAQQLKPSITEEVGKIKEAFTKDIQDLRKDVVALGAKQQNPAFDASGLAKELQSAFGGLGLSNPSAPPPAPAYSASPVPPTGDPAQIPGSQMQMPNMAGGQNPMALIQMIMSFINTPVGAKLAGIEVPGMTQQNPMMTMMSEMMMRGMISNFYNQTMQFQNMNNFMMKKMMADPKFIDHYNETMDFLTEPVRNINNPNYVPSQPPPPTKATGKPGGAADPANQPS